MTQPILHRDAVTVCHLVSGEDGVSRLEDMTIPYGRDGSPFAITEVQPATAIRFRWTPGDCDLDFHPAARRRLVIVLEGRLEITAGTGETRQFGPGDLVVIEDTVGRGHAGRPIDGTALRSALIDLDDTLVHARTRPIAAQTGAGVAYLRTTAAPDGRSETHRGALAFAYEGPDGLETDVIALKGFQYVLAPGDLDYAWHNAPQRQIVLPLTGGMEIENGHGTRHKVRPGEIYFGEDTEGGGHITRAIKGAPRFSIFAHLA